MSDDNPAITRMKDYQEVFGTPHGRRVLKDLLGSYHFLTSTVGRDNNETNFLEGQRSVVVEIIAVLSLTQDEILNNVMEHQHFMDVQDEPETSTTQGT